MAESFLAHACSWFCHPPRHVVECVTSQWATRACVLHVFNGYVRPHGWEAVDAIPACGVDAEHWRATFDTHLSGDDGRLEEGRRIQGPVAPWLVTLAPREDASDAKADPQSYV